MAQKHFFRWNQTDELFPYFELALHEASERGYSPVEIARILGNASTRNIYDIMRNAGILAKLPKGRRAKIEVHPALVSALEQCGLSFIQWANSHDLDPVKAADALAKRKDDRDLDSVAAHSAFKNDFRHLYCSAYELPAEPASISSQSELSTITDYSVLIEPEKEHNRFKASVVELPDCFAYGTSRDAAYFALKSRYVLFHSIRKLKVLPAKSRG